MSEVSPGYSVGSFTDSVLNPVIELDKEAFLLTRLYMSI